MLRRSYDWGCWPRNLAGDFQARAESPCFLSLHKSGSITRGCLSVRRDKLGCRNLADPGYRYSQATWFEGGRLNITSSQTHVVHIFESVGRNSLNQTWVRSSFNYSKEDRSMLFNSAVTTLEGNSFRSPTL